uniref:RRM domain-containing protein n=1 Tax=Electrophorus electricus TaxID=8005 RepID=A0AAY5E8C5_ELEEL
MKDKRSSENGERPADWLETTSITLTQVNGQRKYGGPPTGWIGPAPGPGCEVFICCIPRNMFEDCLIPLFQIVAPLYEFRLMMNISGQNRGFAYAKYGRTMDAEAAIRALHLHPLQGGVRLVVRLSTEKRQLCLGELPAGVSEEALLNMLRVVSDGVTGVIVREAGPRGRAASALVLYSSHYTASMALKVLVQAFKKQFGIFITVHWLSGSSKPRHYEREEVGALAYPGPTPVGQALLTPTCFQSVRAASHDPHPQHFSRSCNAVGCLRRVCELYGFGVPLYDVRYHTNTNGFLCVTYSVLVPGLPKPFCGAAKVFPCPSTNTMKDEAHHIAAKQVLKTVMRQVSFTLLMCWFRHLVRVLG